jgi:UDP-N-acetyl-D-galactosamine dehydrogenase
MSSLDERIAVVGLGYVGLPVALAFARAAPTVGFDIDVSRVEELRGHLDRTGEVDPDILASTRLVLTTEARDLADTTLFVVTVPTPIDAQRRPDLTALRSASQIVGSALKAGAVVVYESTVWPGLTEEICGPILAEASGLVCGVDFHLGYSPERINPGDREHTLERIIKVVSGQDDETLERVATAYEAIVPAGVHRAPSIQVAEAAKVIENTQRDLNIALMNELSLIFDRLNLSTRDVLAAAGTKWNFLPFTPGLVGGHCIGVDPYYLTARAEAAGYEPQVILAGRRINDSMGAHVAHRVLRFLEQADLPVEQARVGVLGLTFKENVPDLRNSRVPDILRTLRDAGVEPLVAEPCADPELAAKVAGGTLHDLSDLVDLDVLVLAVPHRKLMEGGPAELVDRVRPDGLFVDVRAALSESDVAPRHYSAL